MDNKGFLFTISAILISLSIIALASFFATERISLDLSAEEVNNVFDDVETDIEDILKLSVSIEESSSYVIVSFRDYLPLKDGANTMEDYEDFMEDFYAWEIGADLSLSWLQDSRFTIKPYEIFYGYPSFDKGAIWIYNESGNADAVERYVVEIDFDENLANVVNKSISGDLEVVLDAKFANTEYSTSISVARNDSSSWIFNFMDGNNSLYLNFGNNSIDGGIRNSSMIVNITGDAEGEITTKIFLDKVSEEVGVTSSIYLWLKNKVTRGDYIWLAELR